MIKIDFNRDWYVIKEGCETGRMVNLPHDAMIYEERAKDFDTSGAGGYFRQGKYSYTHTFFVTEDWAGRTVILECEAVYKNATVLLNGEKIYERPYGYTDFYIDLSEKLIVGENNEITIIADNSKAPNSRWYSGSGIYREVHLHVGPNMAIAPQGIKVTTVENSKILVETLVKKNKEAVNGEKLNIEVIDAETLETVSTFSALSGEIAEAVIEGAKIWSTKTPNLYICRVSLIQNGEVVDSDETTFGFRTITWSGNGLFINGEETLLRGGCIHHDNGILGAACFADAEERRIRIMKENGFNAIRSSHNPISKAMLDACDRLGVFVMDESFDMWMIHKNPYDYGKEDFSIWWREDTKAMIEKDYNHPSVIMYSIGNEISDLGSKQGQEICKEMGEYVKALDKNRIVTSGINLMLAAMVAKGKGMYGNGDDDSSDGNGVGAGGMDSAPTSAFFNLMMNKMGDLMEMAAKGKGPDQIMEKVGHYMDMPGLNYASSRYRKDAKKYQDRPFVGSETLPKRIYKNWQFVKSIPNLTGDFMWTSWDYLGESGIGTVRYQDKKTKKDVEEALIVTGGPGVIDICGNPRPEAGGNCIVWELASDPVIGVEPYTHADHFRAVSMWRNTDAVASWSWEGCEGKTSDVIVYAPDGFVKLSVNGKQVGKKKVKDGKAIFKKVAYVSGDIEAVLYDKDGNQHGKSKLFTATGKTLISAKPEKTILRANGQDLCFINISLVGENGVIKAASDQKMTVTVEGQGTLQAFGSARPWMSENFYSDTHTTYYGKLLAVVRAGYKAGEIVVTVSGEGIEPVKIMLVCDQVVGQYSL